MYLVLRMVLHMVLIQCLDSFPFHVCALTSCHVSCRWCCASYQLWSTGSQLCMHPVCHPDGLFISTGPHTCMYTRSPVSLSCHSMDMWYMCGLYWTLLLGQVTHDRYCQCLLVLSSGPMLAGVLPGEKLLGSCTRCA